MLTPTLVRCGWMHTLLAVGVLVVAVWAPPAAGQEAIPDGGNTMCPVMTDEPAKADLFVDYEGRRIYFCCKRCRARFEQAPEKYLANLAPVAMVAAAEGVSDDGAGAPPPPAAAPSPVASEAFDREPPADGLFAWSRIGRFLGRMHVLVVHLPIGLILAAALLELMAALRRTGRPSPAGVACLALGAVAAWAAAGLGWLNAGFERTASSLLLEAHRWVGVLIAAVSLLVLLLAAAALRGGAATGAYRIGVLIAALLVAIGGHLGGALVYGPDYLTEPFRDVWRSPGTPVPTAAEPSPPTEPREPSRTAAPATSPGGAPAGEERSAAQTVLDALLAARDAEDLLVQRRKLRIAELPPPPAPPEVSGPAHNEIDRFIIDAWRRAGLREATDPPPVCDDATFARRVYLDLIGVIPTIEELERFLGDPAPDKRARLVDGLLARHDDYAAHWTPFWEDALGSATTELQGGIPTRGNYREWIYASFRENKPFDVMAAELIDPAMPGYVAPIEANANGKVSRVGYIRNETHTDTLQSAANVAQVFLGTSMKCASCHSHFENDEWPQTRFLAFAGMFGPRDLEVIRCEQRTGEYVAAAFPFDLPGVSEEAPADVEGRLHRAALLLTDPANPRFARAIVNRLWKRYLGLGLFEPADDFRLDRPPSHPELLDWLAHDLMAHGYDLKRTIRLILTSRTYQLRYDPALEDRFDVQRPDRPRYFRSPTLRRLTAEQVIDSVRLALTQRLDPQARLYLDKTSTALTRALGRPASRNEISTGRPDDVAIVQSLELLNGDDYHALIYSGRLVRELAARGFDAGAASAAAESLADTVYRAALSRPPTDEERALVAEFLESSLARLGDEAAPPVEITLIDDDLPAGASPHGYPGGEPWRWITTGEGPVFSGERAHTSGTGTEPDQLGQHYALGAAEPMPVGPDDVLFAYVYLDPADPPREIMIQWNDGGTSDGGWAHRAYWGEDRIPFGAAGTASRRYRGPLPEPGRWVRLEVPALEVGLGASERSVVGMSFDQAGGTVYWDRAGVVGTPRHPMAGAVGDLVWALFTGPEFQYIR